MIRNFSYVERRNKRLGKEVEEEEGE